MTNALTLTVPDGLPFIDVERGFDAPVGLVYRAWTEADLVRRWLGPRGYEMRIDAWDLVDGGRYRYVHRDPAGGTFGFHGAVHTARRDELLIQTFEYDGWPDVVQLDELRFETVGDGSRIRGHSSFPSLAARDAMVGADMERGVREGYEQLDELLPTLRD